MQQSNLTIEYREPGELKPYHRNARVHSPRQIRQIADSIQRFGFTNPVLVTGLGEIIAGHGRVEAAKLLGINPVPTIRIDHLSDAERRAYILADNKLALRAGWDPGILAIELQSLAELDFPLEATGFSLAEVDLALDNAWDADPLRKEPCQADEVPLPLAAAVTRRGDCWAMGRHILVCGDARERADYELVTGGKPVHVIFTDPPYNCRVNGHVCGLGKVKHREFAMGSGEMTEAEFTAFLSCTLGLAASCCKGGSIAFVCMDWRGMRPLLAAGSEAFTELKQLCVWNKTNGGMGAFYRSKHELVFVFKIGTAQHTNSFGLGDTGRYRTNVWDYPGISSMGSDRADELARHPTPKPVALVADALRDCSRRGQTVLDPFAGAGSTLIAAEICGRTARVIEYDPSYCDTIVRRYEQFTGRQAMLTGTKATFDDVRRERLGAGGEAGQ